MLMVQLTELPKDECNSKSKFFFQLRSYKEAFLSPHVIATLMEHLADCLQQTERN